MHEEGGRARRGEGRGDLRADMAALAHAGHDDAAGRFGDHRAGALERLAHRALKSILQCGEPGALDPKRADRRRWRVGENAFAGGTWHDSSLPTSISTLHE